MCNTTLQSTSIVKPSNFKLLKLSQANFKVCPQILLKLLLLNYNNTDNRYNNL